MNIFKKYLLFILLALSSFSIIAFAEYPNTIHNIKAIHKESTFSNWIMLDKAYINNIISQDTTTQSKINILQNENNIIISEINKFKTFFEVTNSNAKIYPPDVTGSINALYQGLNTRISIIKLLKDNNSIKNYNYDINTFSIGQNFNKKYKINHEINKYILEENYNMCMSELNCSLFPKGFVENLDIYISPYELNNINGYTYSQHTPGRGETIVLSSDDCCNEINIISGNVKKYSSFKSTLYHELGHIFENDMKFCCNKEAWKEYLKIYSIQDDNDNPKWERNIKENFAEDFKTYLYTKQGVYISNPKHTNFECKEKCFKDYIEKNINLYKCDSQNSYPYFSILFKENTNPLSLCFGKNMDYITSYDEIYFLMDSSKCKYKNISLEIKNNNTNEEKFINNISNKTLIKLDKQGEHILKFLTKDNNKNKCIGSMTINYKK